MAKNILPNNLFWKWTGSTSRCRTFTDNGTIDNSCMFNDGDSASLSKTAGGSPTSTRQFTISLWAKEVLGSDKSLITLSTLSGSTLNPVLQLPQSNTMGYKWWKCC